MNISTVEDYVELYKKGEKIDVSKYSISDSLFARVLKGNTPEKRLSLTEYVEDRSCFCFRGQGMLEVIGMHPDEMVEHLGFTEKYIQQKLHRNFIFEFLVCESTESFRPILADWKGVEFMIKNHFPKYFRKFWDLFESELTTKTYEEIESSAPYSFFSVRSRGFKFEGYLTEERFIQLGEKVELWQWRLFLYLNTGLRELFGGNGWCVNRKGQKTSKEYFLPNILRKDLTGKHIFLPIRLTEKEGNWEV